MGKPLNLEHSTDFLKDAEAAERSPAQPVTWRDFVQLTKPGILFSNLITAFGGFWVASHGSPDFGQMLLALLGTMLVMASGCVLNNYLDRDLDVKMERTKKRALPTGKLQPSVVLGYGVALGVIGLGLLTAVNVLSALLGLLGLFVYVWLYTAWLKRTSVWNTVVGAVSGAVPPVIGYAAVTQTIDAGAIILFGILFLWQMPHFWALGIRRVEEYRAAGYQMLPVVYGTAQTKISMLRYLVLIVPVSAMLYLYGYVNAVYFFSAVILGLIWLFMAVKGFKVKGEDEVQWAKKMFIYSINYLTILFIIMVITTK